ncbi:MAG: hypothetical protein SNH27_17780 [Rikenellaceae bacterium]
MKQQEKSSYEMMFEEMKASNKDLKERLEKLNNRVIDEAKLDENLRYAILVADRAYSRKYAPYARSVRITLQQMSSLLKAIMVSIDSLKKGSEQPKGNEAEKNRHTFTISFKLSRDLYIFLFLVFTQLVSTIVLLMIKI